MSSNLLHVIVLFCFLLLPNIIASCWAEQALMLENKKMKRKKNLSICSFKNTTKITEWRALVRRTNAYICVLPLTSFWNSCIYFHPLWRPQKGHLDTTEKSACPRICRLSSIMASMSRAGLKPVFVQTQMEQSEI